MGLRANPCPYMQRLVIDADCEIKNMASVPTFNLDNACVHLHIATPITHISWAVGAPTLTLIVETRWEYYYLAIMYKNLFHTAYIHSAHFC